MDPLTAFAIAALMMLLNGGVLGILHRDLPEALRPSAVSWRIGTLLQAGGCVLLTVQRQLPPAFLLPVANFFLILGITCYWRALRQFYGLPDKPLIYLPLVVAVPGMWWFVAVTPSLSARLWIAAIVWAVIMFNCSQVLRISPRIDRAVSRRVLIAIFTVVAAFMVLRAVLFMLSPSPGSSIIDHTWLNMITPMVASILPVTGTTAYLLLCSERIRRQWEHAATTDYLTGLVNRRIIATTGSQRVSQAREHGKVFGVALVDIDYFKTINDRYGHDIGDLALKHVAARIERSCKAEDLAGRQGGEEFVVLLTRDDITQVLAFGEKVRQSVRSAPFPANGTDLTICVSIGIATLTPADKQFDDLLRRADQALYSAKALGRDRVMAEFGHDVAKSA
ncbi:GGDEF domain-containing protein [Tahibacter amnicola]|uniref:diguanylate cyclase n=1 Tax=Tahibacter amnicola TaxID=2976241 RepID=A0ABY6BC64_9GAMM|nr:GGDEF domain-containing protein [Tahibacter amnicola]UXI66763.1 GGDEF domain-containing protein [Tahibacter amnicola]